MQNSLLRILIFYSSPVIWNVKNLLNRRLIKRWEISTSDDNRAARRTIARRFSRTTAAFPLCHDVPEPAPFSFVSSPGSFPAVEQVGN